MGLAVRNATADDLDEMMAMREAVAGEGRWIGAELPLDIERDRAVFAESAERGSLFVAEIDGEMVGLLGMDLPRDNVADLGMQVKPGRSAPTRSPSSTGLTTPPPTPST